jgi:CHAD domain-containing protein
MPYRFEDGESVQTALRRCAREELDQAIQELSDGVKVDPVEAVHAARKALKKERSVLRLGRAALVPKERRRENTAFRLAAQRLSGARDADVMIQAFDELGDRHPGQVPQTTLVAVRDHLVKQREAARRHTFASNAPGEVVEDLRAARLRIDDWRLRRGGWAAIRPGLRRSYERGGKAFQRARGHSTVENLHQWRKRAKDLWYHLRLLEATSPNAIGGHANDAHRLSDLLGDDHDLAILRESLIATAGEIPAALEPVLGLIDYRRDRLQEEAMLQGERLYAESPKAFLRRTQRYWKAWRAEDRAAGARQPAELAEATRTATAD